MKQLPPFIFVNRILISFLSKLSISSFFICSKDLFSLEMKVMSYFPAMISVVSIKAFPSMLCVKRKSFILCRLCLEENLLAYVYLSWLFLVLHRIFLQHEFLLFLIDDLKQQLHILMQCFFLPVQEQ